MKKLSIILLISVVCWSCDVNIHPETEFDYNLKSAQVISTNNDFGLELFQEIIDNDDSPNIMISPASVSLALGMAYNGAETTTKDAFDEMFDYGDLTREEVNKISLDLITTLVTNSKGNLLEIANGIWYREGFPVKDTFLSVNQTYYDAEVRAMDFSKATALEEINDWVSDQTHEKITKILEQIDPQTMMILVNALYFNCVWEYEFDKKETESKPFYKEDGSKYADVDMMHIENTYNFLKKDEFKAVEMPYKNGKFSMHLLLPEDGYTVSDIIEMMNDESWNEWTEAYTEIEDVNITMPKFKFAFDRSIGPDLIAMGLGPAFTDTADFSGISEIALMISKVIHKTYIDVNEEGTEAAAVTAVVFDLTTAAPDYNMYIDRPFLFAITENSSKSIIFIGKVTEPAYAD